VGPQEWSGRDGKEKNSKPLPGIEPGRTALSLVYILTELSRPTD